MFSSRNLVKVISVPRTLPRHLPDDLVRDNKKPAGAGIKEKGYVEETNFLSSRSRHQASEFFTSNRLGFIEIKLNKHW